MPIIETCGHESKRTSFSYRGNIEEGIIIEFESGDFEVAPEIILNVLNQFRGQRVFGGFSMTEPTSGGVGEYLAQLGHGLTPRHASFLCAALRNEGVVTCELNGNAVVVIFNQ